MESSLTPEVEQRIRALSEEIAASNGFEADLREELRGHIEDKVRAYLAGEVAMSEEDAFILAREHFGDRAKLQALLSEVHPAQAEAHLFRRILAGTILVLAVSYTWLALRAALVAAGIGLGLLTGAPQGNASGGGRLFSMLGAIAVVTTITCVLVRWKAAVARGEQPWFLRWRVAFLVYAVAGVMLACPLVDVLEQAIGASVAGHGPWFLYPARLAFSSLLFPSWLIVALVWIWWCDAGARELRALAGAASSWAFILWHYFALGSLLHLVRLPAPPEALGLPLFRLASTSCVLMPLRASEWLSTAAFWSAYAFVAVIAYAVSSHLARRILPRVQIARR